MAAFLHALDSSCQSPLRKKSKAAKPAEPSSSEPLPKPAGRAEVTALSNLYRPQLRYLHASCTLVFKYDIECAFSVLMLGAVRTWQDKHRPGRPHPFGACSTALACVLLRTVISGAAEEDNREHKALCKLVTPWLEGEDMSTIAREVSLCAARASAKKTHLILEFRPHLASVLTPALPTIAQLLLSQGGERLDVRPQRGLARNYRGLRLPCMGKLCQQFMLPAVLGIRLSSGCSVNSFHPVCCLSSCKFFFVQGLFKGRPTFLYVCNAFISGDVMLGHGRRRTPPPPPTMGSSATRLPPRMRSDGAVFCARCALESWRFSNPDAAGAPDALFLLLVDLKKDFDAVPRVTRHWHASKPSRGHDHFSLPLGPCWTADQHEHRRTARIR